MSGPFGSGSLQYFSGAAAGFYPHAIDQSLRFEDGDSAYLTRTFGSASNQRTWTWSAWIKRGNLGGSVVRLFNANDAGSPFRQTSLRFDSDQLRFFNDSTGTTYDVKSTQVFRDPSAWYHIVLAIDTTSGTASNRVKMYVNGGQITNFATSTYPAQNVDTYVNAARSHQIGASVSPSQHFDGYMAEVNFIDGSQLDPTSFGETKAGIWIPKDTSGLTFGTNGFRLKFQDSSALGDDTSGNGNDFSSSGLAATDVVLDSPTNNFATMNGVAPSVGTSVTLSEGNLKATGSTSSYSGGIASTFEFESGKWYWEVRINNEVSAGSNHYSFVGAATGDNNDVNVDNNSNVPTIHTNGWSWEGDGTINLSGTGTKAVSSVSAPSAGDVLGFAMDLDNGNVYFYLNGTAQNSGSAVITGVTGLKTNPMVGVYNSSAVTFNFGQDSSFAGTETAQGNADGNGIGDFYYSPPSGYLAICSANLPDPAIDPAQDEEPADYFNTVLYTGTGASNSITGVGFQPDWVWQKESSNNTAGGSFHFLSDSVRGVNAILQSNTAGTEVTGTDVGVNSFDSDGFTMGAYAGGNANQSGETYASWNWLAGGSAVSNTDGTITSSVSANTKAGFSIVSYTGTGANATVGHGLSSAPDLIVVKNRSFATNWTVYHSANTASPATQYLSLNLNSATASGSGVVWNSTAPTSSVFSIGAGNAVNRSSDTFIAYCFHSVDGYSKIGSYTGNGSTDGPFIYTGFRPAYFLLKRTNSANDWVVQNSVSSPFNTVDDELTPNESYAQFTNSAYSVDFVSNGFKIRNSSVPWNASGGTYIYLAFAEQPFKYSNAR